MPGSSLDDRMAVAERWVELVLSTQQTQSTNISAVSAVATQQSLSIIKAPKTCQWGIKCDNAKTKMCKNEHPQFTCAVETRDKNNCVVLCGFVPSKELCIKLLSNEHWMCGVRNDANNNRELLVFPKPLQPQWDSTKCCFKPTPLLWKGHYSNEELCRTKEFWDRILQIVAQLQFRTPSDTIPYIALNFGRWESAISKDVNLVECHGHAHIGLTAKAYDNLIDPKNLVDFAPLFGRIGEPENYWLKDARELVTNRLVWHRLKKVETRLDAMETRFNNRLNDMETRFDNRFNAIEELLRKVVKRLNVIEKD